MRSMPIRTLIPLREARVALFGVVTVLLLLGLIVFKVPSVIVAGLVTWAAVNLFINSSVVAEISNRLLKRSDQLEQAIGELREAEKAIHRMERERDILVRELERTQARLIRKKCRLDQQVVLRAEESFSPPQSPETNGKLAH